MKLGKIAAAAAAGICMILATAHVALAQNNNTVPAIIPPPKAFATAEEHYKYLLNAAHGGTKHTWDSVPKWDGLWSNSANSIITSNTFYTASKDPDHPGGTVKPGILTPAYEKHYKQRRADIDKFGEQPYDRITNCQPAGYPRHLAEPYVREFINTPTQSWQMNDLMNEIRRVYIGQDHVNIMGTYSWLGDTIGFWDGDKLVTWTKDILPGDYQRSQPLTSNQFQSVEVWQKRTPPNEEPFLEVQLTFYDPLSLVKPLNAVYTFRHRSDLEQAGVRMYMWECQTSSNSFRAADGNTNYVLPGEPGYRDARGTSDYPDVPGQSRDPLNEDTNKLGVDGVPDLGGGARRP